MGKDRRSGLAGRRSSSAATDRRWFPAGAEAALAVRRRPARDRFSTAAWCRRNDRKGRWIRHARPAVALAVVLLPIAVVKPAFTAALIAAVGRPVLLAPCFAAARRAAVALSAIAMGTNPEHRLASLAAANALPENHFSVNRHPPTQADFDNGNASWQGRTSFDGGLLMKVAEPEPRCLERRGSLPPSKQQYKFSRECSGADD